MSLKEYRYVGNHPQDFEVGDGKVLMVEPGGVVNLDLQSNEGKQYEWLSDSLLDTGKAPSKKETPPGQGDN